jgi:hypothetical protein
MFTGEALRALLNAKPFVPFRLRLSDGRDVEVRSHEVVSAGRRFAMVGLLDPNASDTFFDRWMTVWYMHVTSVEQIDPGAPPFASPPGPSESPQPTSV